MTGLAPRPIRPTFGSKLLGSPGESRRRLRWRVQILLTASILASNVMGAVGVGALVLLLVPQQDPFDLRNIVAVVVYLTVALVVGAVWGTRTGLGSLQWLLQGRDPDEAEQRHTLRVPLRLVRMQAVFWIVAAGFFAAVNRDLSALGGVKVGLTVLLGGMVTCAVAYLLSEFVLRPVAAQALAVHPPRRMLVPGVTARYLLAWAAGTGIPVVGLLIGAGFALTDDSISQERLAATVFALGGITLVVGLAVSALAIRATVDPIQAVRTAIARLGAGDLDAEVHVYDGTEVGLLQAGFNDMVQGLRERERIRDLFSRHVGEEVAREALVREGGLGGEAREVAVLFVDVMGSTRLAATQPAPQVVTLLNRFFTVVVEVVTAHCGLVNKLVGDAVLAIWNAPGTVDDPAGRALAAARELTSRLCAEVPELVAGVGVAYGEAVAGNVGAEARFEYTVIGDPVNEAARLSEHAKHVPGRVLASAAALRHAAPAEAVRWDPCGTVTLRGRTEPTEIVRPAG